MRKLIGLFVFLAFVGIQICFSQTREVTGTVIDKHDKSPLPGVSVVVKSNPGAGVATDVNGKFALKVNDGDVLVFSFIGMKPQEVTVKGQSNFNIEMELANEALDEVMVVAYGTTKKESFTGSAEIVKTEKLTKRPVANVTKALDGMVTGVQTTSGSGQPGSGASIVIRGYGSISASQTPLYVVDGIPYAGSISSINPNDIESLTVLKDASAGALYGSRGANGVVLITTKKGNEGKVKVNLKANWGISSRSIPRYETLNEAEYLEVVFQSYKNDKIKNGLDPHSASLEALKAMKSGSTAIFGKNEQYNPFNYSITELIDPETGKVRPDAQLKYSEDWMDEAMKSNPLRQEYVASFTGGNEKTKYMFSLGYLDEEGLLKTTDFKRYNGRMNIDSKVTQWLKTGINANYSRNESNTAVENSSGGSNVWFSAQLMAPIFPVFEKDAAGQTIFDNLGKPVFDYGSNRPAGASADWNTIATLYDDCYSTKSDNLSGRVFAELGNLQNGPLQGLKFSVNYGFDLINSAGMTYYNPYNGNSVSVKGSLSKATARTFTYTLNELLSYERKFNKHHLNVMVGHEFYKYQYDYLGASKTGFPFGGLYELDAATTISSASSYQHNYAVESILSRLNYDFDDKYYLSASFRTDGSSRFHEDNRWGNFWSVGANWRISNESFMSNADWVNNLSVKASYGVQGNDNLNTGYYAWQSFYDLGYPNANMSGAVITSLENKELKWEKNANLNIGIETRLFNRFSASIEWYQRKTTDMLMSFPMASSLGFDDYNKNVGSMRNRGWDISLSGNLIQTDNFNWNLTLLGSTIQNKVLKLADKPEIINGSYIIREGETLNSFYTASAAGVDPATGKQLYWAWQDTDGNEVAPYKTDDMAVATQNKKIQGSRIPDLYGSIANEFRFKGFDLSMLCTYSIGGKVLDGVYNTLLYGNYVGNAKSKHLKRAWTKPGDITDIPRIEIGKSYIITDNSLVDASYFALKNITLGYTLPDKFMKRIGIESVRFTATADNVFILNHLKGMDPQYNFTGGTNFGYVPTRTISFGMDVTF